MNPAEALKELFDLLEDYAPTWFSEEQRLRIVRVLGSTPEEYLDVMEPSYESGELAAVSLPCRKSSRHGARRHLSLVAAGKSSANPVIQEPS